MSDGYGHVSWWGFSPALDLQEIRATHNPKNEMNILIVGAGDPRHIVKTMAWAYHHKKTRLHFYVIDSCTEIYARYMILLNLVMESLTDHGLQEKAELFLEIFGNTLVRGNTDAYITTRADEFVKMVTDPSYCKKQLPLINLDALKYIEADQLEAIFKFWRKPKPSDFDIVKCWDLRLRQHLGTRFDSKEGLFDWDYHMQLREKDTDTITPIEYKKWRRTGIAFEIRDGEYNFQNKTLSSILMIKHLGERHLRRGYWGDIVTSPYIAFGIESEEKELLKKVNETYVNSAQDISYHNIISFIYEITYGEKYQLSNTDSSKMQEKATEALKVTNNASGKNTCVNDNCNKSAIPDKENNQDRNDQTKNEEGNENCVRFLPIDSVNSLFNKPNYHHFFDIVYLSNSSTNYFSSEIPELLSDHAVVIIETLTFILNMDTELPKTLLERFKKTAVTAQCELIEPVNIAKDAYVTFLHTKIN